MWETLKATWIRAVAATFFTIATLCYTFSYLMGKGTALWVVLAFFVFSGVHILAWLSDCHTYRQRKKDMETKNPDDND